MNRNSDSDMPRPGPGAAPRRLRGHSILLRTLVISGVMLVCAYFALMNWRPLADGGGKGFPKPEATFSAMLDGTASRPYVTRLFAPFVIVSLSRALPFVDDPRFCAPLKHSGLGRFWPAAGEAQEGPFALWLYLSLLSLALLGEGVRRTLAQAYEGPPGLFVLWGALTILLWPALARYTNYMYDPFTATLFFWALYAAWRRRRAYCYLLIFFAALQKETAVLLPLALLYLHWPTHPRRRLLGESAALLAGVVVVKLLIFLLFQDNPGERVEVHVTEHNWNINFLYHELPTMLLTGLFLAGLALPGWTRSLRFSRAVALMLVPLMFMALMIGFVDELRAYGEAYGGVMALAFPNVLGRFVRRKEETQVLPAQGA